VLSTRRTLTVAAVALAALVPTLAACGGGDSDGASGSGGELRVGVIYLDTQGFYGGVKKGIDDGATEQGRKVKIVETNAQDDASKESTFMTNLVAQQVDAIMLSAASETASVPAIKAAHNADIPVICYNTCVGSADLEKYVSAYTLGDPTDFGYQLGTAAAAYFQGIGKTDPKIGVVNCEYVEVCVQRRAGFDKAMKEKLPGYSVVANQKGGDASASLTAAQNILTADPDVDAFMAEFGDATVGAVKAVQAAGRTGRTVVFGGDMTTEIAKALQDNTILKAQVDISGQTMGKAAVKAAIDTIGGKAPEDVVVPVPVDLYPDAASAQDWLTAHADGIP